MDYRYGSHTAFQIEYQFVWVTKYRYKVLRGEVADRLRELVRQTCEVFEIRKDYLEHHFEPNPNDNFKMEPD